MVELRLESIEDQTMPPDCFISVRVGDTQKLSRLTATRVYRFPQAGDRRYGKIEVFRRIGACSVDIDSGNTNLRQVSVDCQECGFGSLGLRIAVDGNEQAKQNGEEPPEGKRNGTKVKAAKEYLSKHSLEVRLSEIMQSVLRDQPENPTEYLARKLLNQPAGVKLPSLEGLSNNNANDKAIPMPERKPLMELSPEPSPLPSPVQTQHMPRELEPLGKASKLPFTEDMEQLRGKMKGALDAAFEDGSLDRNLRAGAIEKAPAEARAVQPVPVQSNVAPAVVPAASPAATSSTATAQATAVLPSSVASAVHSNAVVATPTRNGLRFEAYYRANMLYSPKFSAKVGSIFAASATGAKKASASEDLRPKAISTEELERAKTNVRTALCAALVGDGREDVDDAKLVDSNLTSASTTLPTRDTPWSRKPSVLTWCLRPRVARST